MAPNEPNWAWRCRFFRREAASFLRARILGAVELVKGGYRGCALGAGESANENEISLNEGGAGICGTGSDGIVECTGRGFISIGVIGRGVAGIGALVFDD